MGGIKKDFIFAHFQKGTLAQLVEQRTENPCVPGSIPGGTTSTPENPMFLGVFNIYLSHDYHLKLAKR